MDNAQIREWLEVEWAKALSAEDTRPDPDVDRLVNSQSQSIRYAVLTQILGKIADPTRSLLCLQLSSGGVGAWDARSFCVAVIVPWTVENQNVIGNSPDPYVSNPLRRARLTLDMSGTNKKDKDDWQALVKLFQSLDNKSSPDLQKTYRRCLAAVARRLAKQNFQYQIPMRIGATKTETMLEEFLDEQSGGLRPMVVATALMKIIGKGFNLFHHVESQGVNEADTASGVPGDIMCYAEDNTVVLAVEVKDRKLNLTDVQSSTRKAEQSDTELSNLLFTTSGIQPSEKDQIDDFIERKWASGLNLHQVNLLDLAAISFVLLDETWRPKLLREIGTDLDRRGSHEHRKAWHDLLLRMLSEEEQR